MKNFRKMFCYLLLPYMGMMMALWGCQSAEQPLELDQAAIEAESLSLNLNTTGRALAVMLADHEVRELIRAKALEQFDGDYDVLYQDIKTTRLSGGETFEERLTSLLSASPSCREKFPNILVNIPKLQLSVPLHCEEWQTETHIPLVAVHPYFNSDQRDERISAYDQRGWHTFLSTTEDPKEAVVVLGVSERTDEQGSLLEDYRPQSSVPSDVQRVSGEYEILDWIRIPDLDNVEGWVDGKPELQIIIVGARANGTMSAAVSNEIGLKAVNNISRGDIKSGKEVNLGLFNWKLEPTTPYGYTYADEIKIKFIEIDDKGNQWKFTLKAGVQVKVKEPTTGLEATVSGPEFGIEYTYKAKDDDCGDAIVDYSHPKPGPTQTGSQYNTGVVRFKME
jgi:hypothetical protein